MEELDYIQLAKDHYAETLAVVRFVSEDGVGLRAYDQAWAVDTYFPGCPVSRVTIPNENLEVMYGIKLFSTHDKAWGFRDKFMNPTPGIEDLTPPSGAPEISRKERFIRKYFPNLMFMSIKKLLRELNFKFDYYIGYMLTNAGKHDRYRLHMMTTYPEKYVQELKYLKDAEDRA